MLRVLDGHHREKGLFDHQRVKGVGGGGGAGGGSKKRTTKQFVSEAI